MSIQGFNVHGQEAAYGYPYLDNKPTIDTELSASSTNAVENRVVKAAIDGKAGEVVGTASGSIASFPDGADDAPVKDLVCAINPVQNLNGYDNPWPAGGGKNLLPNELGAKTLYGVTCTSASDGKITITGSGDGTNNPFFYLIGDGGHFPLLLAAGTYIISQGVTLPTDCFLRLQKTGGTTVVSIANNQTSATFTLSEDTYVNCYLRINKTANFSTAKVVEPMIRLSSIADASYAPYSNICPISGFTGCNVTRTGKNAAKLSASNVGDNQRATPTYSNSGVTLAATGTYGRMGWLIPVKKGETYYLKFNGVCSSDAGMNKKVYIASADGVWSQSTDGYIRNWDMSTTEQSYGMSFTASSDVLFFGLYVTASGSTGSITISELQLELGSSATAYEAYNGNTYAISWNTEAGTVYGGTLDVTSGVLTVYKAVKNLGDLSWYYQSASTRFYATLSGRKLEASDAALPNMLCSQYKCVSVNDFNNNATDFAIRGNTSASTIFIRDTRYTDGTALATALSGVQLVYELANPQTYQLTPTQVNSLLGQNNVWHDANGNISVTYLADTTLFIADRYTALPAIPEAPNADGTYRLKATVSGGTATYSWESV